MIIEQIVEIPADRRVRLEFDVPDAVTSRAANVVVFINPLSASPRPKNRTAKPLYGLFTSDGHEVDRFLERKHADKALEYELEERRRSVTGKIKG
jgi:hypothetical protein